MDSSTDRDWIASEFSKGVEAEQTMAADAKVRVESPPDPTLTVLYGEIADADARHVKGVETIAVRYGHTPSKSAGGGIGEALGRLKDRVADSVLGHNPQGVVAEDLVAKANAIHWYAAWSHTFEALGDTESAREIAAILTEEVAHRDALQSALNRLVERGARGEFSEKKSEASKKG